MFDQNLSFFLEYINYEAVGLNKIIVTKAA